MDEMESGRMGTRGPKLLMEHRRNVIHRSMFYLAPFIIGLAGCMTVQDMASGKVSDLGGKLFIGLCMAIMVYGVWHVLTKWVLDFKCTETEMEITTVLGGVTKLDWSSLRAFSRSGLRLPSSGSGSLVFEGRLPFYLVNMSPEPMDRLEEIIRNQSNAQVKRSWC